MLENLEIRSVPPQKVCFIAEKLTFQEMVENVVEIRKQAYAEAEGNICVLAEELIVRPDMLYELCFPATMVNLKLRNLTECKVLDRVTAVCCIYTGNPTNYKLH